MQTQQSQA